MTKNPDKTISDDIPREFVYFPSPSTPIYAQTLILVVLILVNFGGFLVIARNPPERF